MAKTKRGQRVPGVRRRQSYQTITVPATAPSRRPRMLLVAGIAAAAALGLMVGSLLSARGDDPGTADPPAAGTEVFGADVAESLLGGIPQDGSALGDPTAPVTLVEYADLQCPFCAQWASRTFPDLVEDYVRAGDLRIEFRGMAFIGEESDTALRAALAAGEQDRLWNVVDLFYLNQGAENGGWVTDNLLAGIGRSVPGLDGNLMLERVDSAQVTTALDEHAAAAASAGITGTPSFELGRTGEKLTRLEVASLDADEFRAAIDQLLGR